MKDLKDNFSAQAELYAKFRPDYPRELYSFLFELLPAKQAAWDCGTGNGQVAIVLAETFERVCATDISEEQIRNAHASKNIEYSVQRSEKTSFADKQFDLVTVAQAIHWFDFDPFYKEVVRTTRPGGIFAIMGYGLLKAGEPVDTIIHQLYYEIVGPYWDKERNYIDEHYKTIPFPFQEIATPRFVHKVEWSREDLLGYFSTWSAVQHYKKATHHDPVERIKNDLGKVWNGDIKKIIEFPVLLRVARIDK